MNDVRYFAVFRSDTKSDPEDGYGQTCVALFQEMDAAIAEARRVLEDGFHAVIDQGVMSQGEWDALEEVPDDFEVQSEQPPKPQLQLVHSVEHSARPCGCDPGANWVCEAHRAAEASA